MLWIAIIAGLVFLGVAGRRASSVEARIGAIAVLAALISWVLATRFGPRGLFVIVPALAWLAGSWLRAKAVGERRPPSSGVPGARDPMTRAEALRVLGLRQGADREAIAHAHRNLIKKVHPDHGGSDHLAQQVNEAKQVLDCDPAPPT